MGRGSLVQAARHIKHRVWVRWRSLQPVVAVIRDPSYRLMDRLFPFTYDESRFTESFIALSPPVSTVDAEPVVQQVFMLWTGTNDMSDARASSLAQARELFDVNLVTPDSQSDWVLHDHPLHRAYDDLSLVHRSDYLRAYLMHHHGGIYLDVKPDYGDVLAAARRLDASPWHWIVGFRELGADTVSDERGAVRRALRLRHARLVGTSAFALRPRSPLTREWLGEVDARLDHFADDLARHPGDIMGRNPGYPIPWTGILGSVLHPLLLKYSDRVLHDGAFRPSLRDYR